MAQWNKNYNPTSLIKTIEKSRSINNDGKAQFGGFGIMSELPKLEAMINMNSEITLEDKHGIVQQSVFNTGNQGPLSKDSILAEVNRIEKNYLSSKEQNYIISTSLSIDGNRHKLPNLKIGDNKITFSVNLPKNFTKAINKQWSFISFMPNKQLPLNYLRARISVKAKSISLSIQKALDSLNLYRGIMNFVINFGQQTFSFGMFNRKPINKILLGPIHIVHKSNGEIADRDIIWFDENYREPLQTYYNNNTVNSVPQFKRLMDSFHDIRRKIQKSKIKEELQNAIWLYNNALDSYDYEISFIRLWSALELLTATGQDESHKVTIRRTAFIFQDPEEEMIYLDLLRNFRNTLIHKGYMNSKLEIFVYDLKLYVERLLSFIIYNQFLFENFGDVAYLLDRETKSNKLIKTTKLDNFAKKLNKSRIII